ncbi:hypothetical protein ACFO6R_14820 [Eubacterium multiforme]|uniref:Uncharacterized protein n=1 Tax=Eubacterium multiforme TaxID=83339 RepID=A0ABT9UWJ3_9FIRM|nr:hypothetical protein [Eubacterium multiforme]MDQ0150696.1 hypothetical protein [Eubacterium multiforme]
MKKERVIELLEFDLAGYRALLSTSKNIFNRKHFKEKIEAFEIAIKLIKDDREVG